MSETRDALELLLASLGESAQFAVAGSVPPVLPGLEVAGVGAIGIPVSATRYGLFPSGSIGS